MITVGWKMLLKAHRPTVFGHVVHLCSPAIATDAVGLRASLLKVRCHYDSSPNPSVSAIFLENHTVRPALATHSELPAGHDQAHQGCTAGGQGRGC